MRTFECRLKHPVWTNTHVRLHDISLIKEQKCAMGATFDCFTPCVLLKSIKAAARGPKISVGLFTAFSYQVCDALTCCMMWTYCIAAQCAIAHTIMNIVQKKVIMFLLLLAQKSIFYFNLILFTSKVLKDGKLRLVRVQHISFNLGKCTFYVHAVRKHLEDIEIKYSKMLHAVSLSTTSTNQFIVKTTAPLVGMWVVLAVSMSIIGH